MSFSYTVKLLLLLVPTFHNTSDFSEDTVSLKPLPCTYISPDQRIITLLLVNLVNETNNYLSTAHDYLITSKHW